MSYGRNPYYIIGTRGHDGDVIEFMMPMGSIEKGTFPYPHGREMSYPVPDDAIAQFIAHLASRGTKVLQSWIDRGAALNSDYTGFLQRVAPEELVEERQWLKNTVVVKNVKGKVLK